MEKQSTALNLLFLPFASLLQFLDIDAKKLSILVMLMCIDMLTGTLKAYRIRENITSRRWIAGFLSKLLVLLVPFTIALMAKGVEFDIKWFIEFSISLMIVSEAYSILGNIYTFRTGAEVAEIDALSYLIKKIREVLENMIEKGK